MCARDGVSGEVVPLQRRGQYLAAGPGTREVISVRDTAPVYECETAGARERGPWTVHVM